MITKGYILAPETLDGVPDLRQENHFECGERAAQAVAVYFGVAEDTDEDHQSFLKALGTNKEKSTNPHKIAAYLNELGLQAKEHYNMMLDDLKQAIAQHQPVIVCCQGAKHT